MVARNQAGGEGKLVFADVDGAIGAKKHLDGYVVGEVTNDGADYRWCYVQPKLKQGHKKATRLFMRGARANVNMSLKVSSQNYRTASEIAYMPIAALAKKEVEQLRAKLRELGIDPES